MIKVDKIPELRNNLQNKNFEKSEQLFIINRSKAYKENRYKVSKEFNLSQLLDKIKQIELRLAALEEKLGKEDSIMKEFTGDEKEVDIADLLESFAKNRRVTEIHFKAMES